MAAQSLLTTPKVTDPALRRQLQGLAEKIIVETDKISHRQPSRTPNER
jgi:hypothetical protein